MSVKLKSIFTVLIIAVLFIGYSCKKGSEENMNSENASPKTVNLTVKKVNNVWKVVNSENTDTVVVRKNDKIYWDVVGTDAYFQFPVEETKVFNKSESDSLAGGYTTVIKDGGQLKLKIKGDPEKGPIIYAVFCMADSVFAIQNSPPLVVVE